MNQNSNILNFLGISLKENWSHMRHLEIQRVTVFTTLIALFAVVLYNIESLLSTNFIDQTPKGIDYLTTDKISGATFLIIITIIILLTALLLTYKWNRVFDRHIMCIRNISNKINYINLQEYLYFSDHSDDSFAKKVTSLPRTGDLFILTYILLIIFLTYKLVIIYRKYGLLNFNFNISLSRLIMIILIILMLLPFFVILIWTTIIGIIKLLKRYLQIVKDMIKYNKELVSKISSEPEIVIDDNNVG